MLRALVLGLLLANAAYFAWAQGWLMAFNLAPVPQAEPQRLTQQIHPEAMRLYRSPVAPADAGPAPAAPAAQTTSAEITAPSAPSSSSSSSSSPSPSPSSSSASTSALADPSASALVTSTAVPAECLQAGLFSDAQANALRPRLQSTLPDGSWAFSPVVEPGRWIIYMGRYANEEMVAKKRSELRARGVKFEPVQNPSLNPGLSLGHFNNKADADRELARDAERGVRTARVILERAEVRSQRLTLPAADAAIKAQLEVLKPRLAGKALVGCG